MKILMTAATPSEGGAGTHILELSRELASRGHEIVAVAGGEDGDFEKYGIRRILLPLNSKRPFDIYRSYKGLKKLIKTEKFDIVHAASKIPSFICWALNRKLGFRLVTTVSEIYKPAIGFSSITRWGQYSFATSEEIKEYLIRNCGVHKSKITVLSTKNDEKSDGNAVLRAADNLLEAYEKVLSEPAPFRGKPDVILSGYYGFGNMGDDSILETIATSLVKEKPDVKITALTRRPKLDGRRFGIKCVSRTNLFSIITEMRGAKLLISGGGSLFQDATSSKSLLYYVFIVNLAHFMGMKTYIYSNGVGVIFSEKNRKLTAKAVERADAVTVRDAESMNELLSIGVSPEKVKCTADPAFMINPHTGEKFDEALRRHGVGAGKDYFAVSLRRFEGYQKRAYSEADLTRNIIAACADAAKRYSMIPAFVVMQPDVDDEISREAASTLKEEYGIDSLVITPEDGAELVALLGANGKGISAKFVIGMRLHILIYAIAAQVPHIGLSIDPKIDAIMNTLEESYLFHIPNVSTEDLTSSIEEIMENRENIRASIKDSSARFRGLAKTDIMNVIRFIEE